MLLVLFGIGMFVLGSIMVLKPIVFSNGIAEFSKKSWFHAFEIISRLLLGLLFILLAEKASYPTLFMWLGIVLCFVSVFLFVIGSERHKRFALMTSRIGSKFRWLGIIALIGSAFLIYLGLI